MRYNEQACLVICVKIRHAMLSSWTGPLQASDYQFAHFVIIIEMILLYAGKTCNLGDMAYDLSTWSISGAINALESSILKILKRVELFLYD